MSSYTSNTKRFCSVYKSGKKNEMYLYVDRKTDLATLPDELIAVFGSASHVLDMILTPEKKLARVAASKVLTSIAEKGFYLQMPPSVFQDLAGSACAPKDSLNG